MNNLTTLVNKVVASGPNILRDDVVDKASSIIYDVIDKAKTIGTPLAILALAFCGLKMLLPGSDAQTVKAAKTGFWAIVIGLALVWLGPLIVSTITGAFA